MSINVMNYIWNNSKQKSTKLIAMLALADWSNDEGECYPGITRLSEKCRVNSRRMKQIITDLETAGEIAVVLHAGIKTKSGNTNRYYLKQYRASIGLDDSSIQPRHAQKNTPQNDGVQEIAPHGVQEIARHGVQEIAPYTLVDTSVDTKELQSEDCDTIPFDDKPSQKQMFGHILILFNYDVGKLTKTLKSTIGKVAKELREADYLLEDVSGIYNHVDSKDFPGGFTPSALLKYASEWHSQQPTQPDKPTPAPVNVEPPPAEMIHKWIANGKSIRDILNIMGAAKIPEHKAIKYLNELGVTA